jgi:riboflavin kinase/FMN adenylyltransferase
LLTSTRHQLLLLSRLDLDGCLVLPFTHELANLEPEAFARRLLGCSPPLREVIVGTNWRFGCMGRGCPSLLAKMARGTGMGVRVVRPVIWRGETISSTRIRAAVMSGNLREADAMLGRPFGVLATVVRGRTVGRTLGFPTANLCPHNEVLPPFGVYAVRACVRPATGQRGALMPLAGVLNYGLRPTFAQDGSPRATIELHLLDFAGDLYGQDVEVFFVEKLRDERLFHSSAALQAQIAADVRRARSLLSAVGSGKKAKNPFTPPGPSDIVRREKKHREDQGKKG